MTWISVLVFNGCGRHFPHCKPVLEHSRINHSLAELRKPGRWNAEDNARWMPIFVHIIGRTLEAPLGVWPLRVTFVLFQLVWTGRNWPNFSWVERRHFNRRQRSGRLSAACPSRRNFHSCLSPLLLVSAGYSAIHFSEGQRIFTVKQNFQLSFPASGLSPALRFFVQGPRLRID